jgi:carbon monoxide dehydrogenase subunit G
MTFLLDSDRAARVESVAGATPGYQVQCRRDETRARARQPARSGMRLTSSFRVRATPERVWEVLLDPRALLASVPGCEAVERVTDALYRARLRVKVSYITLSAATETVITGLDPPRRLEATTRGEDASLASSLRVDSRLELHPDGEATEVRYDMDIALRGRLGALGEAVFRGKATELGAEFARRLAVRLEGPHAGA